MPEAGRLCDAEGAMQLALALGELGGLSELAVGAAEEPLPDRAELCPDCAPGLVAASLGDADHDKRQEADQYVGADAFLL